MTVTPLPPATDFTAAATQGAFKTAMTNLTSFLGNLLGTDGTAAGVFTALGLKSMAQQSAGGLTVALNEGKAANVASIASPDIWGGNGNLLHITGTTPITGFTAAPQAGAEREIVFDGALTLTHGSNLILPGGANITTAAGDVATVRAETTTQFRATKYTRADGTAIAGAAGGIEGGCKNLRITNGATPNTQVTVTADAVMLATAAGATKLVTAVNFTLSTLAVGANALDAGAVAASTWYSVWVIHSPVANATAGLLSTSATSPTLPSGYTYKTRVGWVRTDGTGSKYLLRTLQVGKQAQYVVTAGTSTAGLPVMASGASGSHITPTWVAIALASFVPPTAVSVRGSARTSSGYAIVAPSNSYGAYNSTSNPPPVILFEGAGGIVITQFKLLIESSSIYWATAVAGGAIYCSGWEDA